LIIRCSTFNLDIGGGQDAHPTKNLRVLKMPTN